MYLFPWLFLLCPTIASFASGPYKNFRAHCLGRPLISLVLPASPSTPKRFPTHACQSSDFLTASVFLCVKLRPKNNGVCCTCPWTALGERKKWSNILLWKHAISPHETIRRQRSKAGCQRKAKIQKQQGAIVSLYGQNIFCLLRWL